MIILIDASHLMYRVGNSLAEFRSSTGILTGIQYGVLRTLHSLKKKHIKSRLVFVRDGYCHERKALLPSYKESRECAPTTPEVYNNETLSDVYKIVLGLGCTVAYDPTQECDDSIANLVRAAGTEEVSIFSADKDFHQLISPTVSVMTPGLKTEDTPVDLKVAKELWGLDPTSLPLYRSFTGDSSDEIKGIPRLPRAKLIQAVTGKVTPADFYDGDGVLYFHGDWRTKVLDFKENLYRNYRVTKLPWREEEVPCETTGFDEDSLREVFQKLEFHAFLAKLRNLRFDFTAHG